MYSTKALSIKQDKSGITIDYNDGTIVNYLLDFLTTKDIHYTNKNNSIHITCDISETLIDFHKKHKHILPHELLLANHSFLLPLINLFRRHLEVHVHETKYYYSLD